MWLMAILAVPAVRAESLHWDQPDLDNWGYSNAFAPGDGRFISTFATLGSDDEDDMTSLAGVDLYDDLPGKLANKAPVRPYSVEASSRDDQQSVSHSALMPAAGTLLTMKGCNESKVPRAP